MTRNEIQLNSIIKEIEKLNKSKERNERLLAKKTDLCEKYNCNWSSSEWFEHRDAGDVTDKQFGAYFDRIGYEREVEDLNHRLENAHKRLSVAEEKVAKDKESEQDNSRLTAIEESVLKFWSLPPKERQMIQELANEQFRQWKEEVEQMCNEDGIQITILTSSSFAGTTPKGENFSLFINSGYTERSFHCYSLAIGGATIFTSGAFATAYRYIRNN